MNEKQKLESLLYRSNAMVEGLNYFKNLEVLIEDFNKGINETFSSIPSEIETISIEEMRLIIKIINKIINQNKLALDNILDNKNQEIRAYKTKLQEFKDTNKIISELKQKENFVLNDIEETKNKLAKLKEKESNIKILEKKREKCFIEMIGLFFESRDFIVSILKKFESGKDNILDNIGFCAVIFLDEDNYIKNINERINHRSINEDDLRSRLKYEVLDYLKDLVSNEAEIEESKFSIVTTNLFDVGTDLFAKKKSSIDYIDFFNHLFQIPLKIKINIDLDGISLESLSMGQRAIVLLKIILSYDEKPLLIDQPEEDLDNSYIYEHLVEAFKEAKNKRQIMIATHNANLVVNTDAEQVIVAKYDNGIISYDLGTLENPITRMNIKKILEGGDAAFRKREEKYGYIF